VSAERYERFDSHDTPSITSCAPQMFRAPKIPWECIGSELLGDGRDNPSLSPLGTLLEVVDELMDVYLRT
jgi:hypothetical protein